MIVTAFISTLSHGAGLYVVRNLEEIWFYLLACSLCASLSVFLVCIFRVLIGAQQAALMDSWGGASQGTSEVVQPRVDRLDLPTQKEAETLSVDIPKDQVLNAVRQPRI
ncbi:hypothetical protein DSM3645_01110 [Blastopirellula marina DSM 3645]|uniref:Uncharacterized protein n=1 Tax=Blastopirellula marina DSM 3645 TaxID=314230 RepID=A3ZMU4_9BACT|nr:hypothetical protein DSM3645_01110 [Blastopirellula marina DSM 3645]